VPGQIDSIIAELKGDVREGCIDVLLEVAAAFIEACPVDTGNARANTIVGIGDNVPSAELEQGSAEVAQAAGMVAVLGFQLEQGDLRMVNNADYLDKLFAGSSAQAPAGWDRIAVETGVARAIAKAGAR